MPNCSVCKVAAPFHELADGKCLKCLAAELARSKDPANDPEMVWRDDLGWLHKNQLEEFVRLEKRIEELEQRIKQ